jgi:hypothetical protein
MHTHAAGHLSLAMMLVLGLATACRKAGPEPAPPSQTLEYTFTTGPDGWEPGFSDYPANLTVADSLGLYSLAYGWSPMPASIVPARSGIRMRGTNRSDDLFMYIRKRLTGLAPATDYRIAFEVDIASNAPTNAVGIGGPPGEAVTVKAGASAYPPQSVRDAQGWWRMNIDKGNQSVGGGDMQAIGHIGVSDTTRVHAIIRRATRSPQIRKSSAAGELWLIVGTDSGYEGATEIWWGRVRAVLERN